MSHGLEAAPIRPDREADRARVLARVAGALATTLDISATFEFLPQAVTAAGFADMCVIDASRAYGLPDGGFAVSDPSKEELVAALRERMPRSETHPISRVIESGRPLLLDEVASDVLAAISQDDEHLALLERRSICSA